MIAGAFDSTITLRDRILAASRSSMVGYGFFDIFGYENHNQGKYMESMGNGDGTYLRGWFVCNIRFCDDIISIHDLD